jgi:hypothetical protein
MSGLQTLINAIPDAQDGNVITSDYHNTVKAALQAIATQLEGAAPGSQNLTLTVQPNFVAIPPSPAWTVTLGVATSVASSNGFVSLNLPDGVVITQMTVIGGQTSPATAGFANLLVLPLGGTAATTLIGVNLSTGMNQQVAPTPTASGLTASALQSMQTVQNSQFKYAVQAEVLAAGVTINALQLGYTKTM